MRTHAPLYKSGTGTIDLTQPGGVEALLSFHRATFGDARMEVEAEASAGGGDTNVSSFTDPDTGERFGFPDKTPVKDMTPAQAAEYWRHKARKHEGRAKALSDYDQIKAELDDLKAKHQTSDEKAVEAARSAAAAEAAAAERTKYVDRLVAAEFRAANAGRIPADRFQTLVAAISPSNFLTSDGEVDTDKVQQFVDAGAAPADGRKWPDMGQGQRPLSGKATVASAREEYLDKRRTKTSA